MQTEMLVLCPVQVFIAAPLASSQTQFANDGVPFVGLMSTMVKAYSAIYAGARGINNGFMLAPTQRKVPTLNSQNMGFHFFHNMLSQPGCVCRASNDANQMTAGFK